jgi:hypothetical protein
VVEACRHPCWRRFGFGPDGVGRACAYQRENRLLRGPVRRLPGDDEISVTDEPEPCPSPSVCCTSQSDE